MNQRGHSGRVDANQPQIVSDLRALGYSVVSLARVGSGCGDILVGVRGHNLLFEIKDPAQPKSKRLLTDEECSFHLHWRGQIATIETTEQALDLIGIKTGER